LDAIYKVQQFLKWWSTDWRSYTELWSIDNWADSAELKLVITKFF